MTDFAAGIVSDCAHCQMEGLLYVKLTICAVKLLDMVGRNTFLEKFAAKLRVQSMDANAA